MRCTSQRKTYLNQHHLHFYGTQSVKQQLLHDNYSLIKLYIVCGQVLVYLAE